MLVTFAAEPGPRRLPRGGIRVVLAAVAVAYEQYLLQDAEEAREYLAARAPERATAA